MKTITPAELNSLLAAQPDLPLLDVRTPLEFAQVHVPLAVNEPLHRLEPRALIAAGRLPHGRPVYLICRTGTRSAKAAEKFAQHGLEHTVVVEGGTLGWEAAGLPVRRSALGVISLERQVRIAAGALVLTGVSLGWFVHPAFFGLAAFVGTGLVFAGITDYCGMGLLLARAPWNNKPKTA